MATPDEMIQGSIVQLAQYYRDLGLKSIRMKRKIIVFLDDENFVEVEPRHVCIPCEHDDEKRKELETIRNEMF